MNKYRLLAAHVHLFKKMELLEVAQFQSLPVNITRCASKYDQFAFFIQAFAIFRSECIPGVNGSVIKEVRSGLRLWANPVSCFAGPWCPEGGGQRMSSEVRKRWPKQSSQPDLFLTTGIVWCFWPSLFPLRFSNPLNDCWVFRLFSLTAAWLCYLCVSTEDMALHFVHGVHPVRHGAEVEPPEHHLILSQSPWRWRGKKRYKTTETLSVSHKNSLFWKVIEHRLFHTFSP